MKPLLKMVSVLILLAGSTVLLTAQEPEYRQKRERDDVHLRNDCRLAVQVLTHGQPANQREWALDMIGACDESGPPVLAGMWREVAADSASVGRMIRRSVRMRDRRVYDVVAEIARDRSVPALKRAAALHLLGRWAQPGLSLHFRQFFAPEFQSVQKNGVVYRGISDDAQDEGAEPLPATIKSDVLQLARELATMDPSYRLRATASLLASVLAN